MCVPLTPKQQQHQQQQQQQKQPGLTLHRNQTTCWGALYVTTVVEVLTSCVDFLAMIFLVISLAVTPWMISQGCNTSQTDQCPPQSLLWIQSQAWSNDRPYFSLEAAGGINDWHPVNITYLYPNANTSTVQALIKQYEGWQFPPGYVSWTELGQLNVCEPGSPAFVFWAQPYGFCSGLTFNIPSGVTEGTTAMVVMAIVFAGMSGMCLIAARRGRFIFALYSTFASILSLSMGAGAVSLFATWDYARDQQALVVGTLPLRAISPDGRFQAVFPVGVNLTWGVGWILVIVAIILEAITSVISCIAGTSSAFWAEEGPTGWQRDPPFWVDPNLLNKDEPPTLADLSKARAEQGDRALGGLTLI